MVTNTVSHGRDGLAPLLLSLLLSLSLLLLVVVVGTNVISTWSFSINLCGPLPPRLQPNYEEYHGSNSMVVLEKPKRPLSAYNLFFQQERQRLLVAQEEHGSHGPQTNVHATTSSSPASLGFAEMAKTIAAKWNVIDPESKAELQELANQEKAMYLKRMAEWKRAVAYTKKKQRRLKAQNKKLMLLSQHCRQPEPQQEEPHGSTHCGAATGHHFSQCSNPSFSSSRVVGPEAAASVAQSSPPVGRSTTTRSSTISGTSSPRSSSPSSSPSLWSQLHVLADQLTKRESLHLFMTLFSSSSSSQAHQDDDAEDEDTLRGSSSGFPKNESFWNRNAK